MNKLTEQINQLSVEQRAQVERQLFQRVTPQPQITIPRRTATEPLPLSFAQQRLWFIQQLAPHSAFYNLPTVLQLQGTLQIPALQQTLNGLLQRHEVLRTTYPLHDGAPIQVINDGATLALPLVDLSPLPDPERTAHLQQQLQHATRCPFDLTQELPLRATLYRLAEDDHVLLLVWHHIAVDGWSMAVFQREFCHLYQAFSQGQRPTLPTLPIQYADFALWQETMFQEHKWQPQLDYWKAHLGGTLPILDLPVAQPRPTRRTMAESYPGAKATCTLPNSMTTALKTLGQQTRATLFMTVLAGLSLLLYRYSGQTDLIIGTPIANRRRAESEGLIGFFANTLPLRIDLQGAPTVRQFLERLRHLTLTAYENQDMPFEKIVEAVNPVRDFNRQAIFQVLFVFEETDALPYHLPGLVTTPLEIEKGIAEFDLLFNVVVTPHGMRVNLHYRQDLFAAATSQRLLTHWQQLLTAMIATPDRAITRLPMLTADEETQLLQTWNQTHYANGPEQLLHRLIEAQCATAPAQMALIYRDEVVTYGALNAQANQLAHWLRARGVTPATLVAICLRRTPRAVIALLAVLKAGGAFILIDPTWPAERRATILQQGAIKFLLTDQASSQESHTATHAPTTALGVQGTVLCLDQERNTLRTCSTQNLPTKLPPDQVAYVVYTSGSTGDPKGVICSHQALANYALFFGRMVALSAQDRRLQFGSIGSEHFIAEVINTLCGGATLIFRPQDEAPSIAEFLQVLTEQAVTITSLPVAYWQQWMQTLHAGKSRVPASMRVVITGMDQVEAEPCQIWQQHIGNRIAWFNVYGPAEATCVSTYYKADFSAGQLPQRIPIGRPIANVGIYLLDPAMQPVPVGVIGEIYIGGMGVAQGYLHQPARTAERFVPNPFGPGRLYRTGDFARYQPSGDIEFLGRTDHQVKIRGYRVELGEIEVALRRHPAVRQAVVVADGATVNSKRLVAYVVADPTQPLTPQALRHYLAEKLPAYLLPAAFVMLDAMPINSSGKLDRRALQENHPAPTVSATTVDEHFVPPTTPLEIALAAIWSDLLEVAPIGLHSNFFELGGHSLLAVRLLAHIEQQFEAKAALSTFFAQPTIAQLAQLLLQNEPATAPGIYVTSTPLSTVQQAAVMRLNEELMNPSGPQSWTSVLHRHQWYRRRRAMSALLRALPARVTQQTLALLCRSPWWTRHIYPKEVALLQAFLPLLAAELPANSAWTYPRDADAVIAKSLFHHMVHHYNIAPTTEQKTPRQALDAPSMVGSDLLAAAKANGQGIVLVQYHHLISPSFDLARFGPSVTIGGIPLYLAYFQIQHEVIKNSLFANQLHAARAHLRAGGIVRIAPDGRYGASATLEMNFIQRRRPFFTSFAELALMTDAVVIAALRNIDEQGRSCTTFVTLDAGDATMPHAERVERLVRQYVALLHRFWTETPWLVPWYQIKQQLACPPVVGT